MDEWIVELQLFSRNDMTVTVVARMKVIERPMNGDNWAIFTDELVGFENQPVEVQENIWSFKRNLRNIPRYQGEQQKYHNMRPVGPMIGENRQLVTNAPVEFEE